MRRPPQLGQKPRRLHENGTSRSKPQPLAPDPGKTSAERSARQEFPELPLDEAGEPVTTLTERRGSEVCAARRIQRRTALLPRRPGGPQPGPEAQRCRHHAIVGFVDVGKGAEGLGVFTGVDYPF